MSFLFLFPLSFQIFFIISGKSTFGFSCSSRRPTFWASSKRAFPPHKIIRILLQLFKGYIRIFFNRLYETKRRDSISHIKWNDETFQKDLKRTKAVFNIKSHGFLQQLWWSTSSSPPSSSAGTQLACGRHPSPAGVCELHRQQPGSNRKLGVVEGVSCFLCLIKRQRRLSMLLPNSRHGLDNSCWRFAAAAAVLVGSCW